MYVTRESAEGAIVCDTPQPARQGRYILLVYLLYKDEKPSVCLSVRPSDRPADISAVSAWIDVRLARNESCVFWNHVVCLYKSLSATVGPHECAKGTGVR